jgi:hypothetical protein
MDASEREQYRVAIHGDRDAFEMIIRTHSRTLFAIAYGILQSREEAEDIVQDSLVKAWKTRWRVRDPEKFPRGSRPSPVIVLATFFGNVAPFHCPLQLTK